MKRLKHLLIALFLEASDARAAIQGAMKPIRKHTFSGELPPTTLPETSLDIVSAAPKLTSSIVREAKSLRQHTDDGNSELSDKPEFHTASQGASNLIRKSTFSGESLPAILPETSPVMFGSVPKPAASIVPEAKTSRLHADDGKSELSDEQDFRSASRGAANAIRKHAFSDELPSMISPESSLDIVGSVSKPAASIVRETKASRLQVDVGNITTSGESIEAKKELSPNVVRKARTSVKVAADGNVEMDDTSGDLTLKVSPNDVSPVRKHNFSGQFAADGSIEVPHVIVDSLPPSLSRYVRDAKKRIRQKFDANAVTSARKPVDNGTDERDSGEEEDARFDAGEEEDQLSSKTDSLDEGLRKHKGKHVATIAETKGERAAMIEVMRQAAIPSEGVQVLDGGSGRFPSSICVHDASETKIGNTSITAQCCEADGTCRRFVGTNDAAGCVAGKEPNIVPTTYVEAVKKCLEKGLQLCEKSCSGTGCAYNNLPVWTKKPCEAAVRTSAKIPNCVVVNADGQSCKTCDEGYTPGQWTQKGTCRKCTCASATCNCATCTAQGYCTSCKAGYIFDGTLKPHLERCKAAVRTIAKIPNCVVVNAEGQSCKTCDEGYTPGQWTQKGTCRKCTCASATCNCATCTAQGYCTSCKAGYIFDGTLKPHLERCKAPPTAIPTPMGEYTLSALNESDCPTGTFRIESSHACESAALRFGFQFMGASTFHQHPRGCAVDLDGKVTHNYIMPPSGLPSTTEKLICAASNTCATVLCPEGQQLKINSEHLTNPTNETCCEQKADGAECMEREMCQDEIGDLKHDKSFMCDCVFNHRGRRNVRKCEKWLLCLHQKRGTVQTWFKNLLEFSTDRSSSSRSTSLEESSSNASLKPQSSASLEASCFDPSVDDVFSMDCNCAQDLQKACGYSTYVQDCVTSYACASSKVCDSWKIGRCSSDSSQSLMEIRHRLKSRAESANGLESKDTAEETLRGKCR